MSGPRSEVRRSPATHNTASGTDCMAAASSGYPLCQTSRDTASTTTCSSDTPSAARTCDGRQDRVGNRAGSRPLPTAMAPRWMCSRLASLASASTDREEGVGDARRQPFHREADSGARPGAREIEPEPVPGIGDPRHAGPPCRHPRQEAADRHVRVHEVRALSARNSRTRARNARQCASERDAALQLQCLDPETLCARSVQERPFGTDADHLMAARADRPHQRQQELRQREVDVGDLDDLQAGRCGEDVDGRPSPTIG